MKQNKKTTDIFSLENTEDLAPELQSLIKNRKVRRSREIETKILDLFQLKDELTAYEIMAALYRVHGEICKLILVRSILSKLKSQRFLRGARHSGFYKLNNGENK